LACGLLSVAPANGQELPAPAPRPAPTPKTDRSGALIVPVGGAVRLQMKTKQPIADAFNDRENVLTLQADPTDPTRVIMIGRTVGLTTVTLTDINKKTETYQVIVQPDIELLRSLIKKAVPTANVEVVPGVGNAIILTGNVANIADIDTLVRLAENTAGTGPGNVINAMSVGGVSQVQLDVVVAQVSRTEARNRGFSFGIQGNDYIFSSILGGLGVGPGSQAGGAIGGGGLATALLPGGNANIVFARVRPNTFQTFLQALKTEGVAKILNEPKLVTLSGRPARFLAGGRQAVLGPASGINGPGVVYEDVGTELEFLPLVYGNGKIYLEVAPRVRNVNDALGITTSFGRVPGFDEQSVRTSLIMEDGQTYAIGGLIQSQLQSNTTKVPILGELPFVGTLFSTITQTENELELVILVTARLVDAQDCGQLNTKLPGRETRAATDFELFMEGIMEAPRGQRNVFENGRYKAAHKNSPTYQQYPCAPGNCGTTLKDRQPLGGGAACADGSCAPAAGFPVSEFPAQGGPLQQGVPVPNEPTPGIPSLELPPVPMNVTPTLPPVADPGAPMLPTPRGVELPRTVPAFPAVLQSGGMR